MASFKLSYQYRLFFLILLFSWVIVGCFLAFQYHREKEFKAQLLNEQLQLINREVAQGVATGKPIAECLEGLAQPFADLRVTVVEQNGHVAFDNSLDSLPRSNHLSRPEIAAALLNGSGYTVRRHSETADGTYFYSALMRDGLIVRSAVPYSMPLSEMLAADRGFLWFMLAVTLVMGALAWVASRQVGMTISRLNAFAKRAERGETIYDEEAFPTDELGEISSHIVSLYSRLQSTMADRDKQHAESMRQQQEKNRIKRQLTNNINHELKTPIAAIQICIDTLRQHPTLPDAKRQEIIEKCYANSQRLNTLMTDVATLTRLDEGGKSIEMEPISLRKLVEDVEAEFPSSLPIDNRVPASITVHGNHNLLSSVFRNLIQNANSYSQGSMIEIDADEAKGQVHVAFSDNGIGVPAEHLSRIFERFYRIDKGRSRSLGGTGLGLSIVKNAISVHGGTIKASLRPEGGLRFDFTVKTEA